MKPLSALQKNLGFIGRILTVGVLSILALASCGKPQTTTLWETQCDGKPLRLEKYERQKFSTVDSWGQFVWGDKPPIVLNLTALGNSLPHNESVYGAAPFHEIDLKPRTYLSGQTKLQKLRTVIYLDPAQFSRDEFEALVKCFQTHAAQISVANDADNRLQPFQIAGAVYGTHDSFVERFNRDAKDWYEVEPDGSTGRIQLDWGGDVGMRRESMGGLSNVNADGTIAITDPKEVSIAMLRQYKNQSGQALPERFQIVEANKAPKK